MKHTPEPWYVAHHQFIYAAGHLLVGQTACPPALSDDPVATQAINADRIVACLNACAGISEESLADDCWNKMRDDRDRQAALNAELVVELKKAISLRVTLYRHSDMEGDTDKLTDDEIVQRDVFARQWTQAIAKVGETK